MLFRLNAPDPRTALRRQGKDAETTVLAVLSLAVLCISTVAHVATYFGLVLADHFALAPWFLHLAVIAMFGIAVGHLRGQTIPFDKSGVVSWSVINDGMPRWAARLLQGAFVYAIINFALFLILTGGGLYGERRNGEYVLASHNHVVRVVSRAEYEQNRVRNARGMSGHWVLFSLFPSLVFTVRRPAVTRQLRT